MFEVNSVKTFLRPSFFLAVLVSVSFFYGERASAQKPTPASLAWDSFGEDRTGDCLGAAGKMKTPIAITVGKNKYELRGSRLVQTAPAKTESLRVGIISATKDDRDITLKGVKTLIDWLEAKKVDVLLANGDLASNSIQMPKVFLALAKANALVIAYTGNTESCGSFNRSANKVFNKHRNFINGNWVRRFDLKGATLVTLPGYYDKRFTHVSGAAHYREKHVEALVEMFEEAPKPIVFTSHGPPKMTGKNGIDLASGVGHVGDQVMTDMLDFEEVHFGLFGHILEAGGRASDLSGKKKRKQGQWYPQLFLNAGSANPDPWPMLNGNTSYGMGALFEIKNKKARYWIKELKKAY
jgi:Icc-related predicted phosphoesterase